MSALYWIVDHRAPAHLPHGSADPEFRIVVLGAVLAVPTIGWPIYAAVTLAPWAIAVALLFVLAFRAYIRSVRRHVIKIERSFDLADYDLNKALTTMQRQYRAHPALQPLIEPVLVAAYGHARKQNLAAVQERARVVAELVATAPPMADPDVDNADVDELRNILAIRRQMRSEGLL